MFTDIDMNDLTDQTLDIESLSNPEAHPNHMMSYDCLGRTHYKRCPMVSLKQYRAFMDPYE